MTGPQDGVAPTLEGLAGLLDARPDAWDVPSLCDGWLVRHVVAHLTMPVRLTPETFGAELAAAGGDFGVLSDRVALRDGDLPVGQLLAQLRSPVLSAWQPPGGGAVGALSHAVIHALDVTVALGVAAVAPADAVELVLGELVAARGSWFGVDLSGTRLEDSESGKSWGTGSALRGDVGSLVSLASGRTLPDGRALARA